MSATQPTLSKEETARRGHEIYERDIRPHLNQADHGRIVAIDVLTGAYVVGESVIAAAERLRCQHPQAEMWSERVGHETLYRIGASNRSRHP